MSMRDRSVAARLARSLLAGSLLSVLSVASVASAQPLDVRIFYDAPPNCPDGVEFAGRLLQLVERDGQRYVNTTVIIRHASDGYSLEIWSDGTHVRHIGPASCQELFEEATLRGGMARTESSPGKRILDVAIAKAPSPDAWDLARDKEPAPDPVLGPGGARRGAKVSALVASPPPSAPDPGLPGDELAATSWPVSVMTDARLAAGMLPQVAAGAGVTAELGLPGSTARLRLEVASWLPQTWSFLEGPRPVETSLQQLTAGLGVCSGLAERRLGSMQLALLGCMRVGAAWLRSERSSDVEASSLSYATFGSRLCVSAASSRFYAELSAGADVASSRTLAPPPPLGGSPRAFEVSSAQPTVSLSLGWHFGRGAPGERPEGVVQRGAR